jgi:hypothetical protein
MKIELANKISQIETLSTQLNDIQNKELVCNTNSILIIILVNCL